MDVSWSWEHKITIKIINVLFKYLSKGGKEGYKVENLKNLCETEIYWEKEKERPITKTWFTTGELYAIKKQRRNKSWSLYLVSLTNWGMMTTIILKWSTSDIHTYSLSQTARSSTALLIGKNDRIKLIKAAFSQLFHHLHFIFFICFDYKWLGLLINLQQKPQCWGYCL